LEFQGIHWAHRGKSAINNGIFNGLIMKLGGFHNVFLDMIGKIDQRDVSEWGNHFMDKISNFGVNYVWNWCVFFADFG
jgi:hypothetical protein